MTPAGVGSQGNLNKLVGIKGACYGGYTKENSVFEEYTDNRTLTKNTQSKSYNDILGNKITNYDLKQKKSKNTNFSKIIMDNLDLKEY